jgi:Transposase DDE domain
MIPAPTLLKHFSFHPSRIKTMSELISGLLTGCNVQVSSLSQAISGQANIYSKQKRIYRFLDQQEICEEATAKIISQFLPPKPWTLTLDRTNWQFGEHDHNILTLAVVQDGIAVPILFTPLESCGNSSTLERIDIIARFIKIFGKDSIAALLADREFIGEGWFKWLNEEEILFAIRIKANQLLKHPNGGNMQAGRMCKDGEAYDTATSGQKLQVSCKELETEKLLVAHSPSINDAISLYAKRWDIETMFKALKTNGFNLEMSHIKCRDKFKKLLQITAISFAIAVKAGKLQHQFKPIPFRKTVKTKLYSWFKYGLNALNQALSQGKGIIKKFLKTILKQKPKSKNVQ